MQFGNEVVAVSDSRPPKSTRVDNHCPYKDGKVGVLGLGERKLSLHDQIVSQNTHHKVS